MDDTNHDLAILHVVDAGAEHGRKVRLTQKAPAGQIGHDLVFEFDDAEAVEDFIGQLRAVSADAWGTSTPE